MSPDESVWHRHLVKIRLLAIDEVSVRSPDPGEELPVQHQLLHPLHSLGSVEPESVVSPVLSEVDVKREDTLGLVHLTHAANIDVHINNGGITLKIRPEERQRNKDDISIS